MPFNLDGLTISPSSRTQTSATPLDSLPADVLTLIIMQLKNVSDHPASDLNSLQKCSNAFYALTNPILYRHIDLSPKNSKTFFKLMVESYSDESPRFLLSRTAPNLSPEEQVDRVNRFAYCQSISIDLERYPMAYRHYDLVQSNEKIYLLPNLKRLSISNANHSNHHVNPLVRFIVKISPVEHFCLTHPGFNEWNGSVFECTDLIPQVKSITHHGVHGYVDLPHPTMINTRLSFDDQYCHDGAPCQSQPSGHTQDCIKAMSYGRAERLIEVLLESPGSYRIVGSHRTVLSAQDESYGSDSRDQTRRGLSVIIGNSLDSEAIYQLQKAVMEMAKDIGKKSVIESKIVIVAGEEANREPMCEACGS
ncbi:hypothetical protein CI109_101329 [Kwoniella shandongensis]|uniref:F-box domain-containing protein n=1 Tax=Kwoniella shandongensis TaxID=1734106 RepID=A0AAJ8LFN2_9TREE